MSAAVPLSNFGTTWSCVSDITQPAVLVSGNQAVAEAIARRLQTPRGGLIDDPNYGYDLTAFINDDLTTPQLASIQSQVSAECLKDQRVRAAATTVTFFSGVLIVSIVLTTATGPFTLVLSVSAVAANPVQILSPVPNG
jgi:phage baseplate assembly protein W